MTMTPKKIKHQYVFSCGGGVQSTACLILASQRIIPYRTFIFANVGNKAESPQTLSYIENVLKPYAAKHLIHWVDVCRTRRTGEPVDLFDEIHRSKRSIDIPVRMANGAPGRRNCTTYHKIKPIAKWIKKNAPGCTLGKGISTDEPHRATPSRETDCYISAYPLLELNLSRADCLLIAKKAGMPQPPKSSCWFCPYKTTSQWEALKQQSPELFEQAVSIEALLNKRRQEIGKDRIYISSLGARKQKNLDQIIAQQPDMLADWIQEQDGCESGYCMT